MINPARPQSTTKILDSVALAVLGFGIALTALMASGVALAQGEITGYQAVPAEFLRNISIPGQGDQILRPSALHDDRFHDEILIGDPGHNRLVIFTAAGAYKFEFTLNETMTSPRDIATDSQGS